ncbi:hypothetical protein [Sphingopyxis sp.]|uniref:hypothetical protein n=1 Tax=Sphingopyxis sp. TaxID=1908224 RepID=UPI002D7A1589|nr:hypothetical protein [Sphingopyxis sp.]HET6527081.1 hypothetical protein [Sphingopyxis sp.]
MKKLSEILAFLTAAFVPFPTLGYPVAADLTISPALVCGSLFLLVNISRVFARRDYLVAAIAMAACFIVSNIGRNPVDSYLLSLVALFAVIAPLMLGNIERSVSRAMIRGFLVGLVVTLAISFVELVSALLNIDDILILLDTIFPDGRRGNPAPYLRPKAGFFEPSHLAVYLAFAFVIVDIAFQKSKLSNVFKALIGVSILYVGSLSGFLIITFYIAAQWSAVIFEKKRNAFISFMTLILAFVVVLIYWDDIVSSTYFERIGIVSEAFSRGDLVGSEGSRINAFRPVLDYWSENGWTDFFLGTGYGNYSDWLIYRYGGLGVFSSAGRGDIDNIFAAVMLSTGILGIVSYLTFLFIRFYSISKGRLIAIGLFVVAVHFSYGHMISYLVWYLFLVLVNALSLRRSAELLAGNDGLATSPAAEPRRRASAGVGG